MFYKVIRVSRLGRVGKPTRRVNIIDTTHPMRTGWKHEPNVFADVRKLILPATAAEFTAWQNANKGQNLQPMRIVETGNEFYCDLPGHEGWVQESKRIPNRHQRKHGWTGAGL